MIPHIWTTQDSIGCGEITNIGHSSHFGFPELRGRDLAGSIFLNRLKGCLQRALTLLIA
jgi:hypothetical protein